MKNLFILLFTMFLFGCGTSEKEPLIEWSGIITEQSDHFILTYDKEKFPKSQLERVEQLWVEIQTCVGISIDISDKPLIIEYTELGKVPQKFLGYIYWRERYTVIYENASNSVDKHEMLHYLLYLIGTPDTDNHNHTGPIWDKCPIV